jgi:uncharacterized protein YkwD
MRWSLAPVLGFALLLGLLLPSGAVSAPTTARAGAAALEASLVQEINTLRRDNGLRPLSTSQALRRSASWHTDSMLTGGYFSHESPGGLTFAQRLRRFYPDSGPGWTVGENLALFGPNQPTALDVVRMWLGSPLHRANLLRAGWRELGVAVRFAPSPGGEFGGEPTWVITLDLGARKTRR